MKKKIIDNIKTLFYALIIALFIRSLFFQPFYIPSSSMEPNLLIGDRLFVSKYSYGYSRHSFPFSPKIFTGRILEKSPKRGDVIVFKTPADNRTDYIKRLIGLPGDKIRISNGSIIINDNLILRKKIKDFETKLKEFQNKQELPRQLKDPNREVMVSKHGKTIVIDKEKKQEYLAKGWKLAESINESKTKVDSGFNIAGIEGDDDRVTGETGLQIARLKYLSNYQ